MKFSNRLIDSTGDLHLKEFLKCLIVVRGGVIGIELAGVYANFGTKVTNVEGQSDLLDRMDHKITSIVKRNMKKKDIEIFTRAFVYFTVDCNIKRMGIHWKRKN
ncbi:FAD-dependent oxidoreductase [Bacillus cereus]|uniref:Dihydrolipoamide dehydrogenase of pyruvate dehydrogenase complex n=3 Tax=Bacillus thuringiensis TaxID=1428 RepID=A0AAP4V207_BACTU|nr:FAD-dependent oxidoreductase [Bacillus thuringiensis]ERH97641.1 Dihydrolipoyl dehydrogenase [Bacillus thuringiensis T01-328]MEC2879052.1 FAD-dependent oxidoreductase [Bacillus cereus]AGG05372.1 Dihydrolipoamide dehydrogenase of pyruvate dehydrogenase complex [Bacillus thuringiensis serovar thuringiensis str. IS5056]ARP61407.1 dihydrolipoamide dehydrogenase of pyruvate dehydrogenase complex [Bacillus thuringiensis]AST05035.1 dihydrolipoamide dehydrogenase of pyruvate dehydrogenase complex [B